MLSGNFFFLVSWNLCKFLTKRRFHIYLPVMVEPLEWVSHPVGHLPIAPVSESRSIYRTESSLSVARMTEHRNRPNGSTGNPIRFSVIVRAECRESWINFYGICFLHGVQWIPNIFQKSVTCHTAQSCRLIYYSSV